VRFTWSFGCGHGHAVIRPTAPMAIEVFGVRALRIPSFAIEVMSKRSTRALCYDEPSRPRLLVGGRVSVSIMSRDFYLVRPDGF
jgi:hypothetical protein